MESLFSLEVYIQKIDNLSVECGIPAVAFRLLDYPTILIYYTDLKNIEDIEKKIENVDLNETDTVKYLSELRNDSNGYDFNKGKSCLFRKSFQNLQKSISQVPLYITLVDCLDKGRVNKQPKLLGVCSVSLLSLTENIAQSKQASFDDSPAIAFESNNISICNLMGTRIGSLAFTLKLMCYGSSLLKHVTVEEKKDSHINILLKNLTIENCDSVDEPVKENKKRMMVPLVEKIPADGIDSSNIDKLNLSKSESKPVMRDISCQATREKKRKNKKLGTMEAVENSDYDNTSRPPPLYLNLHLDDNYNVEYKKSSEGENINNKTKFLTEVDYEDDCNDLSSDEEPFIEKLVPIRDRQNLYEISRKEIKEPLKTDHKMEEQVKNENNMFRSLKNSMPVLCSLVSEIARFDKLFNGGNDIATDNNLEKNEICSCMRESRRPSSPVELAEDKLNISSHLKSHLRTDQNFDECLIFGHNSPRKMQSTPRKSKPRLRKKELLPRKSNHQREKKIAAKRPALSYGLTRTQRMRYAMTHCGEDLRSKELKDEERKGNEEIDFQIQTKPVLDENPDYEEDNEDVEEIKQHILFDKGIQTSIEKLNRYPSVENEDRGERKHTESAVGFYSPTEPREISVGDLFDDNRPWSSVSTNHIAAYRSSTNQNNDLMSPDQSYSNDSFLSGSAISATSSISLPRVSNVSGNSSPQMMQDDTRQSISRVSLESTQRKSGIQSILSNQSRRKVSNSRGVSVNSKDIHTSSNSSNKSHRTSSKSRHSSNSSNKSHVSNRASPDIPKQSIHSPIKSSYKRINSEDQTKNILNVTIPSANANSDTAYTTSFNSDY